MLQWSRFQSFTVLSYLVVIYGAVIFSFQFLPAEKWHFVGLMNTSTQPSVTYYFWKPQCIPGTLRIGDTVTVNNSPPNFLACVVGTENGVASRALRFTLIWETYDLSLKFYVGSSDGPDATIGTIVVGAPQTPGSGKKRQADFLSDPELEAYATFPSFCFDSQRSCPNYTRVELSHSFYIFDPFQLLAFGRSGSVFEIDNSITPSAPVNCLTTFCACDGCVHGRCHENGDCSCDFKWDGVRCDQMANLCELGRSQCNVLVTCTPANNTYGYNCGPCPKPGFLDPPPQGTNCTDVNECEIDVYVDYCRSQGLNCTNLPGSYVCTTCPPGQIEVDNQCKEQLCGNGRWDEGEQCDGGRGCIFTNCTCAPLWQSKNSTDCEFKCGNGILDPGEECDSNATDSGCRYGRCECDINNQFRPNNSVVCFRDTQLDELRLCNFGDKQSCEEWECFWCGKVCSEVPCVPSTPERLPDTLPISWLVALLLVGLLAIGAVIFGLVFYFRRKKNRAALSELKAVAPLIGIMSLSQVTEWQPPPNFEFIPLAKLPIVFSKETLDFGNASNQFKVNFVYHDKIILFHRSSKKKTKQRENKRRIGSESMDKPLIESPQSELIEDTKHAIKFEFHVPQSHKYSIELNPKSGVIKKDKEVEIDVTLKMNMTTEVEVKIGLELPEKKKYSYLRFFVTSELSPIIDMDEVTFNSSKPIGDGGYGTVYRGTYRGQDVAVKMLKIQDLPQKMLDEFEREIDLLSKLRHKNVVQFIGASTVIGRLAILTEFIELGSANSLLFKSNVQLPYALKVKIALDAARALQFLHHNNILHRDIKPDNLLVVSTSLTAAINVQLTDFGSTQGSGTVMYMAPEILSKQNYGKEADVYSFGVLLWVVYTQKEPYSQLEYSWDIAQHVLSGKREDIPPDCPTEYRELIEKCWAHNLNERPSFDDVVAKLEQIWLSLNADRRNSVPNVESKVNRL